MSRAKNSDEEHDRHIRIDEQTFDVIYYRKSHLHRFPKSYQRHLIQVAGEEGANIRAIEKRFTDYTKTRIAQTVLRAMLRRMFSEGQNRASMPQPARAHWNYVMTGQEEDQAFPNIPQVNYEQGADTQFEPDFPSFDDDGGDEMDFDQEEIDFDDGGIGQSTNTTTGVVGSAPNTQQAFTSADDLDVSALMTDFGNTLADRGGQTGSGQGQIAHGQGQTNPGQGQTNPGQGVHGQQRTSSEVNIAELMGGLEEKLRDDRAKKGTSSSSAAGKRRR